MTTHETLAAAIEAADDARIASLVRGDTDEQERLLADELVYVHSTGRAEGKESYLKGLRAGRVRFFGIERQDSRVRGWGDGALLDCKARLEFEMGGQRGTAHSRVVSAWVRRDGRWQMLHYHSTTLPQP